MMKIRILAGVVLCLLLSGLTAHAYKTGDSQIWLNAGASGSLGEPIKLSLGEQWRIGDDASELYYMQTELKATYKVVNWLSLIAGYTEASSRVSKPVYDAAGNETRDDYWSSEHRPFAGVSFSGSFSGWKVSDRIQAEYRMKDAVQDYFRYRNQVKVVAPWKWTALKIQPNAYYEAFLSKLPDDVEWPWVRQRISAGVSMSFTDVLKGNLYYLKQLDWTSSDWREYNIFGVSVSASF
jgi:hypothetical protein